MRIRTKAVPIPPIPTEVANSIICSPGRPVAATGLPTRFLLQPGRHKAFPDISWWSIQPGSPPYPPPSEAEHCSDRQGRGRFKIVHIFVIVGLTGRKEIVLSIRTIGQFPFTYSSNIHKGRRKSSFHSYFKIPVRCASRLLNPSLSVSPFNPLTFLTK
jgi:hypothetical protein